MRAAAGLNAFAHVGLAGLEQREVAEPDDDHAAALRDRDALVR